MQKNELEAQSISLETAFISSLRFQGEGLRPPAPVAGRRPCQMTTVGRVV